MSRNKNLKVVLSLLLCVSTGCVQLGTGSDSQAGGNNEAKTNNSRAVGDNPANDVVNTVAGSGSPGLINAVGLAAQFKAPEGVAVDAVGNVYVADTENNVIRRIDPTGLVTTLAGQGGAALVDGPPGKARFSRPFGVAVDKDGVIYVADTDNHSVRRIDPDTGKVDTLAGSIIKGFRDGQGKEARFLHPTAIATAVDGSIYVVDTGNSSIRHIDRQGNVSTLAGGKNVGLKDGTGIDAEFRRPFGIAVNTTDGHIYVADTGNSSIRRISPSTGEVTTVEINYGTGLAQGPASRPKTLQAPIGIAVDCNGFIYVSDSFHLIRRIDPSGQISTIGGYYGSESRGSPEFMNPEGIAVNCSGTVIYVADNWNNRIRSISEFPPTLPPD